MPGDHSIYLHKLDLDLCSGCGRTLPDNWVKPAPGDPRLDGGPSEFDWCQECGRMRLKFHTSHGEVSGEMRGA